MEQLRYFMFIVGMGITALAAQQAQASNDHCNLRERVVTQLARHFGEQRRWVATDSLHGMYELFVSPHTGSWTLTVTNVSGETCMLAAGHDYRFAGKLLSALPTSI